MLDLVLMESEQTISVKSVLPLISHIARVQEHTGYYPQAMENYNKIIEIIDVLQDKVSEKNSGIRNESNMMENKGKFYRDFYVLRFICKIRVFRLKLLQGSLIECREFLNELEMSLSVSYRKNHRSKPGANIDYFDSILMWAHLEAATAYESPI